MSAGLTVVVMVLWRITSKAVNEKKSPTSNPSQQPEERASMHDEDVNQVHFHHGPRDLGGEIIMQSLGKNEAAQQRGVNSGSSQAVAGAESV